MNEFDKYLKNKAKEEQEDIPQSVKNRIDEVLDSLPEDEQKEEKRIKLFPRVAAVAACFVFITLFVLPNVSSVYAETLEKVPVIGNIVKVVTIRNYFYSDGNHEMDIDVPEIDYENSEAADYINKDVSELTTIIVNQFYQDLEITGNNGYGSIKVDYETVTNTDRWFTLKLNVSETAASSNAYFKFYHIDKNEGKIVELGDLFTADNYSDVLVKEIKKQMKEQMESDENAVYWINDSEIGEEFASVKKDHNFYWNDNGDLVIVFDKYEVAPGSMGTPEFVISEKVIDKILKPEYKNIMS
ncbi:MAG: RsiV family protein [Eubacteriales bacterium]|nr:RsiV family protein [Eubacteriales bacterium]